MLSCHCLCHILLLAFMIFGVRFFTKVPDPDVWTEDVCLKTPDGAAAWSSAAILLNGSKNKSMSPPKTYIPGLLTVSQMGLRLSEGLTARLLGQTGKPLCGLEYHSRPDGAGIFSTTDGGWIYTSNSEVGSGAGGAYAIRFSSDGTPVNHYPILTGTTRNCGGGATPWGTWMSGEEADGGYFWEADIYGKESPRKLTKLGTGSFESAACDTRSNAVYLTEDTFYGPLRRFRSSSPDNPKTIFSDGILDWLLLESATGTFTWTTDKAAAQKNAGELYPNSEGIDYRNGKLYFVSKRVKLLYILDLDSLTFQKSSTENGAFNGEPDQVALLVNSESEELLYFCEDGVDDCGVFARDSMGNVHTILDAPDFPTETTGLAFSPDKKALYFSLQSVRDIGYTFEIRREDGRPFGGDFLDIKHHTKKMVAN